MIFWFSNIPLQLCKDIVMMFVGFRHTFATPTADGLAVLRHGQGGASGGCGKTADSADQVGSGFRLKHSCERTEGSFPRFPGHTATGELQGGLPGDRTTGECDWLHQQYTYPFGWVFGYGDGRREAAIWSKTSEATSGMWTARTNHLPYGTTLHRG